MNQHNTPQPIQLTPEQRKARAELFAPVYAMLLDIAREQGTYPPQAPKSTHDPVLRS